jgi:mitotic spindle assembly checkpoint protein MAD1
MLRKERDVLQAQVEALQASGRTRILQLRSNPASEAAAIKQATLNALRAENADLLAQLENKRYASPDATDAAAAAAAAADDDKDNGHHFVNKGNNSSSSSSNNNRSRRDVRLVPLSTLENVRQQVRDTERLVAERDKRMRRLKQAWEVQSLEFRKAVASILGWKVDFLPDGHGRVRVTPMFYADAASRRRNARRKRKTGGGAGGAGSRSGDNDDDDDDDDDDNDDDDGEEGGAGGEDDKSKYSIVFDREKNSVHVTGAPDGEFAREIQPLVRFWLDQRDDIPCFLAAATLEYYDRTTRATRAASAGAAST